MLALRPWMSILIPVVLAWVAPPASAQITLDAPGFLPKKTAPPPPPARAPPSVWPRLDPGAVLCRTADDLDRHASNMTARVSGSATQSTDCRIIARPTGIQILSRQGPGRTQVKLSDRGAGPAGPMSGCRTRRRPGDSVIPRMTGTHIIVGAGQAGAWAAVAMRQAGFTGRILLIGEEPWRPYERPPLSKAVLTDEPEPPIAYFHDAERYAEQGIELLLGNEVTGVDSTAHRIALRDGQSLPYDRLLLTVGGRARHLPIHGGDKALYLRTIEDARLIRARLATARRVVCIGAGVIGLEIASSARARGADVTVLEGLPGAMGRSVSPEGARFVEMLHRNAGVALYFGVVVDAIEDDPSGDLRVVCRDAEEFAGDLVIAGVGMQRNLPLAEAAGLAWDGGIVVDEWGRTSAPDIHAAGDVTAFHHPLFDRRLRLE